MSTYLSDLKPLNIPAENEWSNRQFRLPLYKLYSCCMTPFLCPCLPIESSYPAQFSSQPHRSLCAAPSRSAPHFPAFFSLPG